MRSGSVSNNKLKLPVTLTWSLYEDIIRYGKTKITFYLSQITNTVSPFRAKLKSRSYYGKPKTAPLLKNGNLRIKTGLASYLRVTLSYQMSTWLTNPL